MFLDWLELTEHTFSYIIKQHTRLPNSLHTIQLQRAIIDLQWGEIFKAKFDLNRNQDTKHVVIGKGYP